MLNYEDKIDDQSLRDLIYSLMFYIYGVKNGVFPSLGYYSLDDIFVYAGQIFFLPPTVYSWDFIYKVLDKSGRSLFVAPEFLEKGTTNFQSTLYVCGKIIEYFDHKKKYNFITQELVKEIPEDRKFYDGWLKEFGLFDNEEIEEFSKEMFEKIKNSKEKFNIIRLKSARWMELNAVLFNLNKKVSILENSAMVFVKNDFTNVPRQLVAKYKERIHVSDYDLFLRTLYDNVKFNSIVPVIISTLNSFDNIFIFMDDLDNSDYFVRSFVSYLSESNFSSKICIFSKESKFANFTFEIPKSIEIKICEKTPISNELFPEDFKYLSILGENFSRNDVRNFEEVLKMNFEEKIKYGLREGIIESDDVNYRFSNEHWKQLYESIDFEERVAIHSKLAKLYLNLDNPYRDILKSGFHYMLAGKDISAAVIYLRFIRKNLDTYVFSTERMKDIFSKIYYILKRYNRLDSYAFHSLRLKFQYQSFEDLPFEEPLPENEKFLHLKLLEKYINNKEREVIEDFPKLFEKLQVKSEYNFEDFKLLSAYLIYNYSYYRVYDKLENIEEFKNIANNINEKNEKWATLKAEYLLLMANSVSYKDRKEAKVRLEQATKIATHYNKKYLLIQAYNTFGILNDATSLSIDNFRKAIQISNEIGYMKRKFIPTINLLRALLYFGYIEEMRDKIDEFGKYKLIINNPSDLAFYYRILSFLPLYEQKYEEAKEILNKSLEIESNFGLQKSSLRAIILNELICSNYDNARKIIIENKEDPAIKTRAFEYLVNMVLAENDDEFKKIWIEYKNSPYTLLREEILYIFAEKIAEVDLDGFLKEINKWESEYTTGDVKLSLFYILLAKHKYIKTIGNYVRLSQLTSELCTLANDIKIDHPILKECTGEKADKFHGLLHIFKRIDMRITIEQFVNLFAAEIHRLFNAEKLFLNVNDELIGISYNISNIPYMTEIPKEEVFQLSPLEVLIKENIDDKSSYLIYIYSENYKSNDPYELEKQLTLLQELFSGQLRGIILRERANIDSLTGLYNRWKFNQFINELFDGKSTKFSVFIADIDSFKKINDTYGHIVGDNVLKNIAKILKEHVHNEGLVARYGGEEFVGILYGEKAKAIKICDAIRENVEKESSNIFGFRVTISIGMADVNEKENVTELLGLADQRLYKAKEAGKNRVVWGEYRC
ncbi:diguanylate cyclase [Fervidobacterium sp. 2310opik-2]|uniref:diguanylate cyclase n=1 Tax=Fervidobacterium sp. 2310opik-2 TaxID=1755815 RepID=UPI0013E0E686|nr:diguanylate cyclase [Fervidobacterium sp. 2310opik-2]KAF2961733.1 hypothetical protein AS161_07860 [Fervidobacterium sp. 2310opik-2]